MTSAPSPSRFERVPRSRTLRKLTRRRCARSLNSTCGRPLNSLVTMSRPPSPSRSRRTAARVPSEPITVSRPAASRRQPKAAPLSEQAVQKRFPRSAPPQSRVNQTWAVSPFGRGSTPSRNSLGRKCRPASFKSTELIPYLWGKFMPAATKMSSHPSALRSSTLGPQGQYVSTPAASETSSNRPPPRFANSAFPKMNRSFPPGKKSAGACDESALLASAAQLPGGMLAHMSECMSVRKRSSRPSPSKSNTFTPIAPQGVLGK